MTNKQLYCDMLRDAHVEYTEEADQDQNVCIRVDALSCPNAIGYFGFNATHVFNREGTLLRVEVFEG